ncbi:MAG: hypothetical protein K2M04_02930 [Muribaculaceae bacterium]|nr:hypothetical protein [Muribaculaceae bacterium]
MADNYLERRMEEHRRGGGEQSVRRVAAVVASSRLTENDLVVRFPALRVMIAGNDDRELTEALARRFRSVGGRVALVAPKDMLLTKTGQQAGCRIYQANHSDRNELERAMADAVRAWGGVDVMVMTGVLPAPAAEMASAEKEPGRVWLNVAREDGDDASDVALATLMAVHRSAGAWRRVKKIEPRVSKNT